MFQLRIRILARQDLQQAVDYYDSVSTKIADAFLEDFYTSLDFINNTQRLFRLNTEA